MIKKSTVRALIKFSINVFVVKRCLTEDEFYIGNAAVVKLADTPDSGSGEATHAGSSPVSRKALPFGKGSFLPDEIVGQKRAGFFEPGCAAFISLYFRIILNSNCPDLSLIRYCFSGSGPQELFPIPRT